MLFIIESNLAYCEIKTKKGSTKMKHYKLKNASVEEVSLNKTKVNTPVTRNDGTTKTVDSRTESTVFPVTPEKAKRLAESLRIEDDGKFIKLNLNEVNLAKEFGISALEALVFAQVVEASNRAELFIGYFQTLKVLEKKGYVKNVEGNWLPSYAETYDNETLIKAVEILLRDCVFNTGNVLLDVIDNLCYYEDCFKGVDLCKHCEYGKVSEDVDVCTEVLKKDEHHCRKVFLRLVQSGVIK